MEMEMETEMAKEWRSGEEARSIVSGPLDNYSPLFTVEHVQFNL